MKVGQRLIFKNEFNGNPYYKVGQIYIVQKITNNFGSCFKHRDLPNIVIDSDIELMSIYGKEWCATYYMDKSIWEPIDSYTKSKPSWL